MMAQGAVELEPYEGRYSYVEFDLTCAGNWPVQIPVPVDAVISSLAVHHLNDERKQSLFGEISHLAPGGWYLNYDPVTPPTRSWRRPGCGPVAGGTRPRRTSARTGPPRSSSGTRTMSAT